MTNLIQQVIADMHSCGIVPTDPSAIVFDTSEIIRFHVAGDKSGSLNGFWRGFSDGIPAGVFGSWKTGQKHLWTSGNPNQWSDSDRAAYTARIERIKAQRDAEQASTHAAIARDATERFNALPDASPDQGYLVKKRIAPLNAKQDGSLLVLAIQDWDGAIHSLQTIAPNGRKMMLKGGAKKGYHILIGGNPEGRLLICEGYATGVSLVGMDTEAQVIAAVDAYNLRTVAQAARERFPTRGIVLCADNDPTGVRCATSAAKAISGKVLIPPEIGADWNDFARNLGGAK